jgi:hypothetical protein
MVTSRSGDGYRPLERDLDAVCDEVEGGAALHLERLARVVGEHEDGRVVRRILTPPALPVLVSPRPADRPEHVAAHDGGADVDVPRTGALVIEARLAALAAVIVAEAAGRKRPLMQRHAALAERVVEILVGAGHVAVD